MSGTTLRRMLTILATGATVATIGMLSPSPAAAAAPSLPSDVTALSTPYVDPLQQFVVARGADGTVLVGQLQPPIARFVGLGSIGGSILGDPQAASLPGGLMIFARDVNNQVVTRLPSAGSPGFVVVPGLLVSSEVEVVQLPSSSDQLVRIFARGLDDGAVYTNLLTTAGWTGWQNLGGFTTSEIAAALTTGTGNTFRVVVRGADNRLASLVLFSDGNTSGWVELGGPTVRGNVGMANRGFPGIRGNEIFVQDATTRAVMTYDFNQPGWRNLGGVANSDIAVIEFSDGSIEFLVRGTTNQLYANRRLPGATNFFGYVNLSGLLTSNPGAGGGRVGDPNAAIVVRGTNQQLFTKLQRSNFDFTEYFGLAGPRAA
jgi:hypothetical protein